jgi:hypothetical protein
MPNRCGVHTGDIDTLRPRLSRLEADSHAGRRSDLASADSVLRAALRDDHTQRLAQYLSDP